MNLTVWLALAPVSVLEGLGSAFYPKAWRRMISAVINLPDNILHRFGGELVVMGVMVYYMLRKAISRTKNRLTEVVFECKKCCNSEEMIAESIFKQTVILKNG